MIGLVCQQKRTAIRRPVEIRYLDLAGKLEEIALWRFVETRGARLFRIGWICWLAIDFLLVEEANAFLSDEASSLIPERYSDIITGLQDNDRVKPRRAVKRRLLHGDGFDRDGPQSTYSGFMKRQRCAGHRAKDNNLPDRVIGENVGNFLSDPSAAAIGCS